MIGLSAVFTDAVMIMFGEYAFVGFPMVGVNPAFSIALRYPFPEFFTTGFIPVADIISDNLTGSAA